VSGDTARAGGPGVGAPREVATATRTVQLVPMRRRHLRGVLRIEGQNPHRPWSLGLFMSELRQPDQRAYVVALDDGRVVGFAGELFADTDAHVTTISVDPSWRRHRVGTQLMLVLCRRAIGAGMTALTLEVAASNRAAQALYHRFGLAPVGVRKNYYEDLAEDAVIMWAHGIDQPEYAERLDRLEAELAVPVRMEGWPS
jgi:ribosomal-protein-alanine N-acetyltransferase